MKTLSSYHQQRLWFIDHFEKDDLYDGPPVYHNVPLYFQINGVVDENRLRIAFEKLLETHDIFRTRLHKEEGSIYQEICTVDEVPVDEMFIASQNLSGKLDTLRQTPFDFKTDCFIKLFYEIKENTADLFFVLHHAIADRRSLEIIERQFRTFLENPTTLVQDNKAQFYNFSDWQNGLSQDDLEPLMFYWKSKLKDVEVLYFPTDMERAQVHIYKSATMNLTLKNVGVIPFCIKNNISPRSLILAAYKMALAKLSGLSDIVIGTSMDLRNEEIKTLCGPIENLVVLRSLLQEDNTLMDIVHTVDREWKETADFKTMPFDKLVLELNPKKDMSRTALFDILFVYQNIDPSLHQSSAISNEGWGKYDFNLLVNENQGEFHLALTYNALYYTNATAHSLLSLLERCLDEVIENENLLLKEIPLVAEQEQKELLKRSLVIQDNPTQTIIDLFSIQAIRHGSRDSLAWSEGKMTYKTLDQQSNQLAHFLIRKHQIRTEDKVAIRFPKSEQLIVSIMAVLKTGAAYVPVNPDYPEERQTFMIEDAACKLVIDEQFLSEAWAPVQSSNNTLPNVSIAPEDLAYIIYTSGTTGKPKGVMIEHGNVISLLKSCYDLFSFSEKDVWTFFHSSCFDFSIWEIFGSLLSGGKLLILKDEESRNPEVFVNLMAEHEVSVFSQTPSAFYNFIALEHEVPSLRYVVFGGESLNPLKLKHWSQKHPQVSLVNMYGITETTVHVTYKLLTQDDLSSPLSNIGKPLSFANCLVLDKAQNLLPYGRPGELYVFGNGVARGYLNRPEVNAERFIQCPFDPSLRLYRTGDMARFTPSGDLEYLGRIDDQVKIRGYRIELDEIKKQMETHPGVQQSAITLVEMPDGDKAIAAYVALADDCTVSDVKLHIATKVPAYMVPAFIIKMTQIPINVNGKIDKKNLPSPIEHFQEKEEDIVAPSTEIELKLFDIWTELLNTRHFGIRHNFFELGGHSLKATRLISLIHKAFNVRLELKQIFANSVFEQQAKLIQLSTKTSYQKIPRITPAESYPISGAQRRLWVLSQLEEATIAYNMPAFVELDGSYDMHHFKQAIHAVVDRHEILRTVFKKDETGEVRQWVLPKDTLGFDVNYQDFSNEEHASAKIKEAIQQDNYKSFDLQQGPLLRTTIYKQSTDSYIFYYNIHHIISDGWSMNILRNEVLAFYQAFTEGQTAELADLSIQYKDYAAWQLQQLASNEMWPHKEFWMNQFSGALPLLELPTEQSRPRFKTYNGARLETFISKPTLELLHDFTTQMKGTLFISLLAAFKVLLYKYTREEDIIIGSPVAGRAHADLEHQIGFYINTLALRNQINGELGFEELHEQIKSNTLKAFEHQSYPFDLLVEELELKNETSRNPLFDVMLVLQNGKDREESVVASANFDIVENAEKSVAKFDLEILFQEVEDVLSFQINYNTDIYDKEMVSGLMRHFKELLVQLLKQPETKINEIDYLTDIEKESLLSGLNPPAFDMSHSRTIVEMFEEQVDRTPESIASVFQGRKLTYRQLDETSNRFAHFLIEKYDVKNNDLVAIKLERSDWVLVVMLGILRAGGAYVPIDQNYPPSRIAYLEQDSNCKASISESILADFEKNQLTYSSDRISIQKDLDDLAYVIYTSGSTGKPKGVTISHNNLYSSTKVRNNYYDFISSYLLVPSFSFDSSVAVIWGCLTTGGALFVVPENDLKDPATIGEIIYKNQIDYILCVPSYYDFLLTHLDAPSLPFTKAVLAGEALSRNLVERHYKALPHCVVYNEYGPTENTVWATATTVESGEREVHIGKPIANTQICILDSAHHLVPRGVAGEICLGGPGVASGYLNRPDLTSEKFIDHPFQKGKKLYKTGDLGSWLPDGNIKFIGRTDDQVKIRGRRIELKEIEQAVLAQGLVKRAIVDVRERAGEKVIALYFTADKIVNKNELRDYLGTNLPSYMVPGYYVKLEAIPLNSHGKVNKKALPEVSEDDMLKRVYVAASSQTEKRLVEIWKEILEVDEIGLTNDFFELGGHSLNATSLISAIHKTFDVQLELKQLFANPVLEQQAELIAASLKTAYKQIPKVAKAKSYPLSDAQRRLWVTSQFEDALIAYNIPSTVELNGVYDIEKFKKSIYAVVDRHEILRTVFRSPEDETTEVRQWILNREELNFKIQTIDLRERENQDQLLREYIQNDTYRPFDLQTGPLLRAVLFHLTEDQYIFYYNMHHIISDGWSMDVLAKDVMIYYHALEAGLEPEWEPLRMQYKDYAVWQQSQLAGLEAERTFWKKQLQGELPTLDLPGQKRRPKMKTYLGANLETYISAETTTALKEFNQKQGGSLFMALLASWNVLFYKYTNQKDIILGTPVAGRSHDDLKNQIGFYINALALRNQINETENFEDFYQQVKQNTLNAFDHQMYAFDKVIEDVDWKRDNSRNPLFDIFLVLKNTAKSIADNTELADETVHTISRGTDAVSRFDLEIDFKEKGNYLYFNINYNTDIYDERLVKELMLNYKSILSELLSHADQPLREIDYQSIQAKELKDKNKQRLKFLKTAP